MADQYFHDWSYRGPESWVCTQCGGTTRNPVIGNAKSRTCIGRKPSRRNK